MAMRQEQVETSALSRRKILGIVGLGGATIALAACGSITTASAGSSAGSATSGSASGTAGATATPTAATPSETWLYMSILTGKQDGKSGYPEFVPSNFSVPANCTVHGEIRCFDDGPATVPSGYEKVQGTVDGTMSLISGVVGDLSTAAAQTVQSVDPKNVAHTLTMSDIGVSIPIPPLSTVRFTFKTGATGTHVWQCMASCGTGDSGWAGPMADAGYMQGKMTVQA